MPAGFDPPEFAWLQQQDAWFPLVETAQSRSWGRFLLVIARLRPESTVTAARAELASVAAQLEQESPAHKGWSATAVPLREQLTGEARTPLIAILVAVALLLLLAVTNVGTLTISMMRRRVHELAIRRAIGATDRRLRNQLLVQSLLIGLVGTALGVLTAFPALGILQSLLPPDLPRAGSIALDWPVLLVAVATAMAATVAFAGVAARQARRAYGAAVLLGSARVARTSRGGGLVAAEIALGLALGVLALLTARSFVHLRAVDLASIPRASSPSASRCQGRTMDPIESACSSARWSSASNQSPVSLARVWSARVRWADSAPRPMCTMRSGRRPRQGRGWWQMSGFRMPAISPRCASGCCTGQLSREPTRLDGPPVVLITEALARNVFGNGRRRRPKTSLEYVRWPRRRGPRGGCGLTSGR